MSTLQEHATAIGIVCINWSWMERSVEALATHLLNKGIASIEAHCVFANVDFREMVEITKALCLYKQPSQSWFEEIEALLNKIDNDLRPQRNRVVHDIWFVDSVSGKAVRTHIRTKLVRLQSREPKQLSTMQRAEVPKEEIERLANDIQEASSKLLELAALLPDWPKELISS